ncbi:MAG TPA: hypothetical protein PK454_08190 [Anaerolineaceae bacterium]|jgi:hypothetical protein|nr:hypothetical protein [Anaerolineaceae bacterium]
MKRTGNTPLPGERLKLVRFLLHPITVLAIGLFATAAVLIFWRAAFGGWSKIWLFYQVPLIIPLIAFCADRIERMRKIPPVGWGWDGGVIILALLRAVVLIPGYSGHALFLAYSLFSSQSWVARITAGLVLVEVAYLKIFVWQDKTIIGGILLALAASGMYRWLQIGKRFMTIKD